ncbi:MAG: (deoxy)nucleoside triphosphate pyrophosphohydrolase [Planctomycetaceae bacterium]
MDLSPDRIGIAVVEHAGRYLVGVRGDDAPLPGKAEFPGGKCAPRERSREAVVRECLEETGLPVVPVELLAEKSHDYPHGRVQLAFWRCRPANPIDVREEHRAFRWVAAAELASLDFPEANAEVVRGLIDTSKTR